MRPERLTSAQDVVVRHCFSVILKKLSPKVTAHPCRQLRQTESAYHILCWSFVISKWRLINFYYVEQSAEQVPQQLDYFRNSYP